MYLYKNIQIPFFYYSDSFGRTRIKKPFLPRLFLSDLFYLWFFWFLLFFTSKRKSFSIFLCSTDLCVQIFVMSLFPFFLETEEVVHFLDDLCGDLMTQFLSHFLLIFTQRLRDYLAENVLKLFHPVTDRWVWLLDDGRWCFSLFHLRQEYFDCLS